MPEHEKIIDAEYLAQEAPYNYQIILIGEHGTKMLLVDREGSWVEGLLETQKIMALFDLRSKPELPDKP